MSDYIASLLAAEAAKAARRKCFISYYSGDKAAVDKFISEFSDVFIPKAIGVSDGDDFINSNDPDYVDSTAVCTSVCDFRGSDDRHQPEGR